MSLRHRVTVVTSKGMHLFYTHRERAEIMCQKQQAVALTDKVIQLTCGTSLGSIRHEHMPRIKEQPKRRTYHGATVPSNASRLTWAPRYDKTESGLPGSLRHLGFRHRSEVADGR